MDYTLAYYIEYSKLPTIAQCIEDGFTKYQAEQAKHIITIKLLEQGYSNRLLEGYSNEVKHWLVLADSHYPYQNQSVMRAIFEFALDYQPDGILHLGDMGDFDSITSHNNGKPRLKEGKRLVDSVNSFKQGLDLWRDFKCKKVITFGNHENRLERYYDVNPELEGIFDLHAICKERGWESLPMNIPYMLGKLNCEHGLYHNLHHAKKHIEMCGVSVLYGHLHTNQVFHKSTRHSEISGTALGATCDLNPDYMQNRPKGWCHNVATVSVFPDGTFNLTVIDIIDGRFTYNKKVYDGNINEV
jgi:predicted phosphodiesterase